jgi:hypothetical protein
MADETRRITYTTRLWPIELVGRVGLVLAEGAICADMARLPALICRRSARAFGARRSGADRQIWHGVCPCP